MTLVGTSPESKLRVTSNQTPIYMYFHSISRICILIVLVGFSTFASAQSKKSQLRKGDHAFDHLAYSKAITHYLKFSKANPRHSAVFAKLGDSYRLVNDPKNAAKWYAEAVASAPQVTRFYYASMLMQNEQFEEAAKQFEIYLKSNTGNRLAQARYKSCVDFQKFYANEGRFNVSDAGNNTAGADFCPVVSSDNKVLFSSNRQQQSFLFAWLNNSFLDLYESDVDPNSLQLSQSKKLKGSINSKYHEATATFSPSGDTVYFTRNNYYKGKVQHDKAGTLLLQTYSSVKNGNQWGKITPMNFNNDEYSTGHPALFANGNKMIMVSDMPGTLGGTDLYMVEKQGETWGPPINMGPNINSEGNEMFPWVAKDGTLFFASDGHQGLGGLDVFMSSKSSQTWSIPENLGSPVNTTLDDFGLSFMENGVNGYFSSNRSGGKGDDDIFAFTVHNAVIAHVIDKVTQQPIEGAVTRVFLGGESRGYDKSDEKGEEQLYLDGEEEFLLETDVAGYSKNSIVIKPTVRHLLEPLAVTIEMTPASKDCNPTAYLDGSIFTNNTPLPPGTKVTIREKETELVIQPGMKFGFDLEVGKEYIVEVKSENMPAKVYPVNALGAKDNDTLDLLVDIIPKREDIGKVFYIIYYNFDKHDIRMDASKELDDLVTFMKKYPTIMVEMGSHTDSRGTTEYNNELSRNRAIDAQSYIVARGIARERITYKFYGEGSLTNDCNDANLNCTEEQHQLNRRTEFKLIGM